MSDEFSRIFSSQFSFVNTLSTKENNKVIVMRHNALGQKIIRIDTDRNFEIYSILKRISHPNLPQIYGIFNNENGFSVVEEYIDGLTVADVLDGGTYREAGAIAVCRAVCSALSVLHENNIIHRDIKPENIMIDTYGNVKLIDFDAARICKLYQPRDTQVMGTDGFAAPEQFGRKQTDARSDIYAMGVLLNVMLTGQHPSVSVYPGALGKIIKKCCNVNPDDRYSSAAELFGAL